MTPKNANAKYSPPADPGIVPVEQGNATDQLPTLVDGDSLAVHWEKQCHEGTPETCGGDAHATDDFRPLEITHTNVDLPFATTKTAYEMSRLVRKQ